MLTRKVVNRISGLGVDPKGLINHGVIGTYSGLMDIQREIRMNISMLLRALLGALFLTAMSVQADEPKTLHQYLLVSEVNFVLNHGTRVLIVLSPGTTGWTTPTEACAGVSKFDTIVRKVVFTDASTTTVSTDLVWNSDTRTLTNLGGRNEATCN